MYEARTLIEATRKWWHDALPHISVLARELGIDFALDHKDWLESGHSKGLFYKHGQRDLVQFIEPTTMKIVRIMGDPIPKGEQKNELAVVADCGPNDYDSQETLTWSRQTTRELSHTESKVHGWSVTITEGIEAGGEAAQFKKKFEMSQSAHGEYSDAKAETESTTNQASHSTQIELPKGEMARILQTVRTGEIEVPFTDYITLQLGWKVADYKKRIRGKGHMLDHHSGFGSYAKNSSKQRWHWRCPDDDDFRTLFEGTNPRYPGLRNKTINDFSPAAKRAYEWLMNEDNRKIIVRSKAVFKQGVWGNAKVERLDADGDVISTEEVI